MYKSLQAGRAFAALLVVLFHLGESIAMDKVFDIPFFAIPFSFGDSGVHFFFVLSGFIIMTAHRRDIFKPVNIGGYLKKRMIRIYPIYWIVFFLTSLLALFSSTLRDAFPNDIYVLLKSLLLFPQDKTVVGGTGAPVVAVAWTLQYELTFYAFFAVMILSRAASLILGSLWLYAYILFNASASLIFPLSFLVDDYILLFFFGMAVSIISTTKSLKTWVYKYPMIYLIIGGGIFTFIAINKMFRTGVLSEYSTLLLGVSSALIILGLVLAEGRNLTIGSNKWIQMLGDSSYSLYLIHAPLIAILCKLSILIHLNYFGVIGALVAFIIILIVCIFAAVYFHLRIEIPLINYLRNFKYDVRSQDK